MIELSIVMPCLNEAETLGNCIDKARQFLSEHQVNGEVIVSDNGSTDGSPDIAIEYGATLVHVKPCGGYGKGLMTGIAHAKGQYIIMGDSDDSYDFSNL